MLLAIDIGNTETVIGVFDDEAEEGEYHAGELTGLVEHWRVSTQSERTADEQALLLQELCAWSGLALPPGAGRTGVDTNGVISGIAVSSSVPMITATLREMGQRWPDVPFIVVEPGIKTGMSILYDSPKDVGADRIVNAVAAYDLYGGPCIVVDLGTATTFDVISEAGEYLGGAIAPGLAISMNALFAEAAALRRVELVAPPFAIGRSTVESMQVGAVFGHAALVDGLCRRIEAELGPATIVTTGGLGGLITPHASVVAHYEPWLMLHGLRLLYVRNVDADTRRA